MFIDAITCLIFNYSVGHESQQELSEVLAHKPALTYDVWGAIFIPLSGADNPDVIRCWQWKRKTADGCIYTVVVWKYCMLELIE